MEKYNKYSGILTPIFSLPSNEGIGTFGKGAYDFVDFLDSCKQSYWQVLPLNPVDEYYSPYASSSSFAGNFMFIDLELLQEQFKFSFESGEVSNTVDYVFAKGKGKILREVYGKYYRLLDKKIAKFYNENKSWLKDYCIYCFYRDKWGSKWDFKKQELDKIRILDIEELLNLYGIDFSYYIFEQYIFYQQWHNLKTYANEKNIKIIGDLPFYCGGQSCDTWANAQCFKLVGEDEFSSSGVPGDNFNREGQVWNTPVYNWKEMQRDNYSWWLERLRHQLQLFDVIKLDHFRGYEDYWEYFQQSPLKGQWKLGPGKELIKIINSLFKSSQFIAEDLGHLNSKVISLLEYSEYAAMEVIQFAFYEENSKYLPHNHRENALCYIGTHDNNTLYGWTSTLDDETLNRVKAYYNCTRNQVEEKIMESAFDSKAEICILQLQDFLKLGSEARFNSPGTVLKNWRWRCKREDLSESLVEEISNYTRIFGRNNGK